MQVGPALRGLTVLLILVVAGLAAGVAVWAAITFKQKHPVDAADCQGLVTAGVLAQGVGTAAKQDSIGFCTLDQHWTIGDSRGGWDGSVATLVAPLATTEDTCRQACQDPSVPCQAFAFDSAGAAGNQCALTVSGADALLTFSTAADDPKSSATEVTALKLQIQIGRAHV